MISLLKLVERQIASSALRTTREKIVFRPGRYIDKEGVGFGPCLLVSRECGSGSSQLAHQVADRLGWSFFDSEIVDEIAKAAHVQQRLVRSVDEHVHSLWDQTWREWLLEELPDQKYLHHLHEVIMALGHQGNVVLVGRGAQFFLPPQCALRVRLVASKSGRMQRLAEEAKISLEEARLRIDHADAERSAFIRKTFKKDLADPLNHDLVINTGDIGIDFAIEITLAALEQKLGIPAPAIPRIHRAVSA